MRFSTVILAGLLSSIVQAAPANVHTVVLTSYTTVIVDQHGATITPSDNDNNPPAAAATEAPSETTPVAKAALPTENVVVEVPSPAASPVTTQAAPPPPPPPPAAPPVTTQAAPPPPPPAQTTTSSAPSTTTTQANGAVQSGQGTYYDVGMGACGVVHSNSENVIAISHQLFDKYTPGGNPNHNTLCGKKIRASYQGKSVDVTIVDRCEGCQYNDLDFSPTAFESIADKGLGRIPITWQWLDSI
ncbi:uncharacterized protein LODBEIA_P50090 [Lodderomyces beijingensis]|uniref:RlpA-like protein double-psi beta-barrel domain-containing protein n=1 Tax=Lodderomyces beijingensis TaxID=1775926 RepID=A0ABP0ZW17_9ASCO